MKRPAVFFDRDNTLIVSDGFLGDPSKVVLVEGAGDAVARVRSLGFAVVIFSNQSGVARGMFNEDDVHRVNARLDEMLQDQNPGAVIDRHEFCPFHPEGTVEPYAKESELRKPKPGMINQAAEKLALEVSRSWVIGDAPRDIEAGKAAGCRTIWYKDPRLPPSMAARELMLTVPDAVVSSLKEATDVIARDALIRQPPAAPEPEPGRTMKAAAPRPAAPPVPPEAPVQSEASIEAEEAEAEQAASERSELPAAARRAAGPRSVATARPLMQVLAQKRAAAAQTQSETQQQPSQATNTPPVVPATARLEELAEQILQELQRRREAPEHEFSVSKLLAGIIQIVAIAVVFLAYFRGDQQSLLLVAVFLQTFTIALLIMGRQR